MAGMNLVLILPACIGLACGGVPSLFRSNRRDLIGTVLTCASSGLGLIGAVLSLAVPTPATFAARWSLPVGHFALAVDAVSAIFLIPIFLISGLGSVYALAYWSREQQPQTATKVRIFYGLLSASMVLVVIAHDLIVLLIAWEVMALSAFFLVTTHDDDPQACRAGWVYLVATHLATLALIVMASLMNRATGSFDLVPVTTGMAATGMRTVIFGLALVGFGLKAGIMPLHVWLPGAHANAPSHVSALMSGVMIKMGIYGIVRVSGLLADPPLLWGAALLALGVVSGVLGVVFAIAQHDLKRLLAYHSIENIGIILLGLGLAVLGRTLARPDLVLLGMAGALLHVWNHGLFKSLLFLSAGSVIHAAGTREIDRMGGMAAGLPRTAMYFLIGAVAICGLPPLNGFVSELLIYIGLFRTTAGGDSPSWSAAALAVPALAMIGALAVACFVKVFGTVFLGAPRHESPTAHHEAPAQMTKPLAVLAVCCFAIGLVPAGAMPAMQRAAEAWSRDAVAAGSVDAFVPLAWISIAGMALLTACIAGWVLLTRRMRREAFKTVGTWDCGYARPTARMQYTASSFAQSLVGIWSWALRPQVHAPRVEGVFPARARFESHVEDTVLDLAVRPAARALESVSARLRVLQHGRIHLYILYILAALVGLLLWVLPTGDFLRKLLR